MCKYLHNKIQIDHTILETNLMNIVKENPIDTTIEDSLFRISYFFNPRGCHSGKGELETVWVGARSQVRFPAA